MTQTEPNAYTSTVTKPADFGEFWEAVEAEAAKIPLNSEMTLVPMRSTPEVEVYEVFYDSLDGVRIAGWYCLPRQRSGPVPALVAYPGYISEPALPKEIARRGYAAFGAAPRGKLRSHRQYNPGYPGLLTDNIIDRNTYAYRGFYVDAWRVIDFLETRPEVDASRIGVAGSSQGGALTLLTTAMRPQVAAASAGAPYLAGMVDAIRLTHTYPYEEINEYLRQHPDQEDQVTETLAYFDCINFVDRIRCPILVNIGVQDNVCPAPTGYAVFDRIASPDKKLFAYDGHGHDANGAGHAPLVADFFRKHLKPEPQTSANA